jgi:hypothetical protein
MIRTISRFYSLLAGEILNKMENLAPKMRPTKAPKETQTQQTGVYGDVVDMS